VRCLMCWIPKHCSSQLSAATNAVPFVGHDFLDGFPLAQDSLEGEGTEGASRFRTKGAPLRPRCEGTEGLDDVPVYRRVQHEHRVYVCLAEGRRGSSVVSALPVLRVSWDARVDALLLCGVAVAREKAKGGEPVDDMPPRDGWRNADG